MLKKLMNILFVMIAIAPTLVMAANVNPEIKTAVLAIDKGVFKEEAQTVKAELAVPKEVGITETLTPINGWLLFIAHCSDLFC